MPRTPKSGRVDAEVVRARVGAVVRRGVARAESLAQSARARGDQPAARAPVERRRPDGAGTGPGQVAAYQRLHGLYESLRRAYAGGRVAAAPRPSAEDIEEVQTEALNAKVFADFFRTLSLDGDFDAATVTVTRRMLARSQRSRARMFLQVFQQYTPLRPVAEICLGICAFQEPMLDAAWTLFTRNDLAFVLRWAAPEFVELAFARDAAVATGAVRQLLAGELPDAGEPGADVWLELGYQALAAGERDLAGQVLQRAETGLGAADAGETSGPLRRRLTTLQEWIARAERADTPNELPAGEIPLALVGNAHPDRRAASRDLADLFAPLATAGHLLRHRGVTVTGDAELVAAVERLRDGLPGDRVVPHDGDRTVRLFEVDRGLSRFGDVPDGTWLLVTDWFDVPLTHWQLDIPLDRRLRPLFVSFRIVPAQLATPGAVEYLREHGPVGCRDRETVYLLHGAGVPAFYSGVLESTLDLVLPPAGATTGDGTVFVDAEGAGPGRRRSRLAGEVRDRSLAANLDAAVEFLTSLRAGAGRVVTGDLRVAAAARAVGCVTEFRPGRRDDGAVADHLDTGDAGDAKAAASHSDLTDKLAAAFGAILDGLSADSADQVYDRWREACAADVQRAEQEMRSFPDVPELGFDLDDVCRQIRAESMTFERREPGPDGPEVHVEFSLDENYTHQLEIVLDSVVERCSRPVRAYLCARGLTRADVDRFVALFPTVSFVWLRTDGVEYGKVSGKIKWATIVTMDRTVLPALLPDLDRIIHFDLDALCLGDLAELYDVDMRGEPIAAVDEAQQNHASGYHAIRNNARRLRREGSPELARELLIRTHAEHPFDFTIFNAGIMVLNLAAMRADDFAGRHLVYVPRFGVNGQNALNFYAGRRRAPVDPDWNRLVRLEVVDHPKVAHWAGPFKPWAGHYFVADRHLWRRQEEHFAARTAQLQEAVAAAR